jgi:hypothetical protein
LESPISSGLLTNSLGAFLSRRTSRERRKR